MREKSSPWAAAAELFDPAAKQVLAAYYNDPVRFVRECFIWPAGEGPTEYQDEILHTLAERKRVAARGPHGLGKTSLAAWSVLWFSLTRSAAGDDWKIPTTASAWRQLTHYLWPEIHKWARRLDWDKLGREPFTRFELLQYNLKLQKSGEAFSVASDDPATLEGAHANQLFYLYDESKTIPGETFDAAEGAFSGAGADTVNDAYALAVSTPGETSGRFYDICRHAPGFEDWATIHVGLDRAIAAGRISREWADQRAKQWGTTSAVYQNRVLGEFAANDEDGVIPLAWVEAANLRWQQWADAKVLPNLKCVGVDVARGGGDKSVLAIRHGNVISELVELDVRDTMQIVGAVVGLTNLPGVYSVIDDMGVGGGVTDRLREQSLRAVKFIAAGTDSGITDASGQLGMVNNRAAAWWNMRDLLDPDNGHDIALPSHDLLTGDLTAPHWRVMSGGKIQVESKDDIRKRIGRSTDYADAVIQAFWPATGGSPALVPSTGRYRSEMADVMTKEW